MDIISIATKASVVAQAKQFSEVVRNITKIPDPINASFSAAKLIVSVCSPPRIKYPFKFTILLLQLGVCVSTGGAPSITYIALGIEILDKLV